MFQIQFFSRFIKECSIIKGKKQCEMYKNFLNKNHCNCIEKNPVNTDKCSQDFLCIGVTRFELAISRPPDERFTRLSHTPIKENII